MSQLNSRRRLRIKMMERMNKGKKKVRKKVTKGVDTFATVQRISKSKIK